MTFSSNETWTKLWEKYNVSLKFINQTAKCIHEMCELFRKFGEIIKEAFSKLTEKLRGLFNLVKETVEEEISCNNYKCFRRYYKYQPQLKVNTKGYAPCLLPVTRRYI